MSAHTKLGLHQRRMVLILSREDYLHSVEWREKSNLTQGRFNASRLKMLERGFIRYSSTHKGWTLTAQGRETFCSIREQAEREEAAEKRSVKNGGKK